jgi:hypothetical protein
MGCRARLLIQIPIEYSRGEASGTRQGSYATDRQIELNAVNAVSRNLAQSPAIRL